MKMLLLQVAALGLNFLKKQISDDKYCGFNIHPIKSVFPALTCTVQATMRTAALPSSHGIVGNGFFFKEQWKPLFWEQNSRLIEGPRIWDNIRLKGKKICQMFLQQSLGVDSDIILSPAPIHKHHGGMILDCYSMPSSLQIRLNKQIGNTFPLHHYWGPLASIKSTKWISQAVIDVMKTEQPDFLYSYLPHLDYELQKSGPDSPKSRKAFNEIDTLIRLIIQTAIDNKYHFVVFGDYNISNVKDIIFPNKLLYETGLFAIRKINEMLYPDFHTSKAFAVVDHQIAHLYVFDKNKTNALISFFSSLNGVDKVLFNESKKEFGIDHRRAGDIVLIAKPGFWFDYRWWKENSQAPDYAYHVDIHNKPGYDPCELFFGWPPMNISQDPYKVKGTHGRVDENEPVFFISDLEFENQPKSLVELANEIGKIL